MHLRKPRRMLQAIQKTIHTRQHHPIHHLLPPLLILHHPCLPQHTQMPRHRGPPQSRHLHQFTYAPLPARHRLHHPQPRRMPQGLEHIRHLSHRTLCLLHRSIFRHFAKYTSSFLVNFSLIQTTALRATHLHKANPTKTSVNSVVLSASVVPISTTPKDLRTQTSLLGKTAIRLPSPAIQA